MAWRSLGQRRDGERGGERGDGDGLDVLPVFGVKFGRVMAVLCRAKLARRSVAMVKVDMSPIFVAQPQEMHETATSSHVKPVLIRPATRQESSRRPRGAADTSKIKNLPVLSNRLLFRRSGRTICMAGAGSAAAAYIGAGTSVAWRRNPVIVREGQPMARTKPTAAQIREAEAAAAARERGATTPAHSPGSGSISSLSEAPGSVPPQQRLLGLLARWAPRPAPSGGARQGGWEAAR